MDYKLRTRLNTNFAPVKFRLKGKQHYQIFLDIESDSDPNLDNVMYVKYRLHETFKSPERISNSRYNKFMIEIKAWGTFNIKVTVGLKNGETYEFDQDMQDGMKRVAM